MKLRDFSFCSGNDGRIEPFSTFNRLSTLILSNCTVPAEQTQQTLYISSTTLLSLSTVYLRLLISKVELFAPNLCSFTFTGNLYLKLYGSSLDSIKEASIDVDMDMIPSNHADTPLILLDWLIELVNIKSLTASAATLRVPTLTSFLVKFFHIYMT